MRITGASACIALCLVLCACFCLTELAEVDLHWHLLSGTRIMNEGRVPRVDDLTFTSAGRPWVDLQWLFEVLIALALRVGGWRGLDLLKVALVVGGFGIAALAAARRGAPGLAIGLVLLPAVVASQERFSLRPEAASFLMLGALLLLLEMRRDHPRRLWLVVPLFALWANLHSLYAVGLALLGLVAAGDLIDALRDRRPGRSSAGAGVSPRPILLALCGALPATLVTPYGLAAWELPRRLLLERIAAENLYARGIVEFQAPFGGYGITFAIEAFALLVTVVAAVLAVSRGAGPASDFLLVGAFLALALLARRNIPLFALVVLPLGSSRLASVARRFAAWIGARHPRLPVRRATVARGGAILLGSTTALLIIAVTTNRFYARDSTQRYFGSGEAPAFYPHRAAQYVASGAIRGEVLNDMTMGGFLAWSWFPARRVFIDGRLEVHDPALFAGYLRLQQDPRFFEDLARRYGIGGVLWSHRESAQAAPLLRYLAGGHGWKPIEIDAEAALFEREEGAPPAESDLPAVAPDDPSLLRRILEQIRREEEESARRDPLPRFVRFFLPRREVPVAQVNAALFFASIGSWAPAERLFHEALARSPGNPVLQYDLGLVLDRSGRSEQARRAYETAIRLAGEFAPARAALALQSSRAGDWEGALEQWRLAERREPLGPASLEARGAVLARLGRIDEAIQDYRGVVQAAPRRVEPRAALAELYLRAGLRQQARDEIRRALSLDPSAPAPRIAMARIDAVEGDTVEAERIYRAVIADQPASAEAHLGLAVLLASTGRPAAAVEEAAEAARAGADAAALSEEPALRALEALPQFRKLLAPRPETGESRQPRG